MPAPEVPNSLNRSAKIGIEQRNPHSRRPPAQPQEPRSRPAYRPDDGRDRPVGLGQIEPRVRHALRGRPAPLRRNLQRLRAPVSRPDGPAAGGSRGRRAARHRDRPDQSGAQFALDRRHDDRAERSPEAASTRAPPNCSTARRRIRCATTRRKRSTPSCSNARARTIRASRSRSRSSCPKPRSDEEVAQWLSASGYTRVQAKRHVETETGARQLLDVVADRFRLQNTERSRALEAIEGALLRGDGPRERLRAAEPDERRKPTANLALLHRPAQPGERPPLRRSAAGAVLVQLGLRRVRDVPRFRPRDRRRSRPRDSRRAQDAARKARSRRCRRPRGRKTRTT